MISLQQRGVVAADVKDRVARLRVGVRSSSRTFCAGVDHARSTGTVAIMFLVSPGHTSVRVAKSVQGADRSRGPLVTISASLRGNTGERLLPSREWEWRLLPLIRQRSNLVRPRHTPPQPGVALRMPSWLTLTTSGRKGRQTIPGFHRPARHRMSGIAATQRTVAATVRRDGE